MDYTRFLHTIIAVICLAAIMISTCPGEALAQFDEQPEIGLSPYWWTAVSRWHHIILPAAQERELDPDLIAAVIWKESLGRAWERGPVGAVGLMGIMPFTWRPSVEELKQPWTNVNWGARTLAHTIRDGRGDLYYSLAAYNGGWDKIHLRVTRNYAADVLSHYAKAIAARYDLPEDGSWIAIFAIMGNSPEPNTITVVGPQRPLARYTERPWIQANIPTMPVGLPPHAIAIKFTDAYGVENQINVWLASEDGMPFTDKSMADARFLAPPEEEINPSLSASSPGAPTATPAPASDLLVNLEPTQTFTSTHLTTEEAADGSLADPAMTSPLPTPTPTSTVTSTLPCPGGPLQVEAWDLGKRLHTERGWIAKIYIGAYGGDCNYVYTWNGEVKGEPTSGAVTFEIYQVDRFTPIMGTASVTSISTTVETKLFIEAP
ncbi:MAG TPA: hypothetical protein ENN19_10585 [Chloroflexi bacterium]|nr:hypothetical protein [Chloroflexota bacterium]